MFNLFKSTTGIAIGAAVIATAVFADSHAPKVDPAVTARQSQMKMVGYHIGLLGAMAKGEMEFDAEMASGAAENINALANMKQATIWTEGTAQGEIDGTRAKAEIWSDWAGFSERFEALASASSTLVGVSDIDGLRAGMGDLGGTCKACHEKYRGPQNE